jgi:hypothetical protein
LVTSFEQPLAIEREQRDIDLVPAARAAPFHGDRALRLRGRQTHIGRATGAMHRHALAAREVAHDRFARQRLAAARGLREQVADAFDGEVRAALLRRRARDHRRDHRLRFGLRPFVFEQRAADLVRADVAERDEHDEFVFVRRIELREHRREVRLAQARRLSSLSSSSRPACRLRARSSLWNSCAPFRANVRWRGSRWTAPANRAAVRRPCR